jgi:hypothetical protein
MRGEKEWACSSNLGKRDLSHVTRFTCQKKVDYASQYRKKGDFSICNLPFIVIEMYQMIVVADLGG